MGTTTKTIYHVKSIKVVKGDVTIKLQGSSYKPAHHDNYADLHIKVNWTGQNREAMFGLECPDREPFVYPHLGLINGIRTKVTGMTGRFWKFNPNLELALEELLAKMQESWIVKVETQVTKEEKIPTFAGDSGLFNVSFFRVKTDEALRGEIRISKGLDETKSFDLGIDLNTKLSSHGNYILLAHGIMVKTAHAINHDPKFITPADLARLALYLTDYLISTQP